MGNAKELELIAQIKADTLEACGSCSLGTKGIVDTAIDHMLTSDVSSEFHDALEAYRENLSANVEDSDSRRHAQRIQAAQQRGQGIYFLADGWGRLLNEWIDGYKEANSLFLDLDGLYRIAPKNKPTQKWHKSTATVFERHSQHKVLESIRHTIRLLTEPGDAATHGLSFDSEAKLRAMVFVLAAGAEEQDALLLRKLAIVAYRKIPDVGPLSTGVGNLCIQALADLEGTAGLVQLSELASQLKYPANAVALVRKKVDEVASAKGISASELENMTIPDHGLSD